MKSASSQLTSWGARIVSKQAHVRRVRRDAGVEQRVVGQRAVGPDPQPLVGLPAPLAVPRQLADVALVDRVRPVEPLGRLLFPRLEALEERRQRLGVGHVGHGEVVLEARLGVVEGRLHVEDRASVLDGHHAARREALPVADPVDLVEDRHGRVARAQEVRVQRVDPPVLDGAPGGDQRLGRRPGRRTPAGAPRRAGSHGRC